MNHTMNIAHLRRQYLDGTLTPPALIDSLLDRMAGPDDHHIWISRLDADALHTYAHALKGRNIADLPLYGIPFAIKDNIDLAGCRPQRAARLMPTPRPNPPRWCNA
jgi:allophanate hydrolase